MFRTSTRRTHRAAGPAVIDYRSLTAPVGRTVGGMAVLGAVTATASLQAMGSADAAGTPTAPSHPSTLAPSAPVTGAAAAAALPATAPAAYTNVKLRSGARGAAVSQLQRSLNASGARLAVDGSFGPKTLSAVKSFQRSAGIGVDGVVGPKTWSALGSSSSSGSSSSHPKLRSGSRGSAVKTLQRDLNDHGAGIAVDGSFGPATLSSVKSFQRAAGIYVDGVVGPNTWSKLATSNAKISGSGGSSSGSVSGQAIVNKARSAKGTRYSWGGSSFATGFDCSGLVKYAYNANGITVPRTAKQQAFGGRIISKSQAQPGDLVAFTGNNYGHIGIYVGGNTIIDASSSQGRVVERTLWNDPHIFVTYR
jgi:peptidoglycan hydrolase-like protein with peptidoglycan-binding domain